MSDTRKLAVWNIKIVLRENVVSNVNIEEFWDIHRHMSHLIDFLALPSMNAINVFRSSFIKREEPIAWVIQLTWISLGFWTDLLQRCTDKSKGMSILITYCPSCIYPQVSRLVFSFQILEWRKDDGRRDWVFPIMGKDAL